jgi:hypothetical protein
MSNIYRALCAELVEQLQRAINDYGFCLEASNALMHRALAAVMAEPVAPTDEALLRTYGKAKRDHCYEGDLHDWPKKAERAATVAGLRAVLARFGIFANKPVPVSERLPGAEDCDAEGRCWWFVPENEEQPSHWYLDGQPPAREICFYGNTHWRPYHALPIPTPAP